MSEIQYSDFETDEQMREGIGICATVLEHVQFARAYDENGKSIPRAKYRRVEVTGETTRSWIIGRGYGERKIPKKTLRGIFSNEGVDRRILMAKHAYKLIRHIDFFLKQEEPGAWERFVALAELVGYDYDDE